MKKAAGIYILLYLLFFTGICRLLWLSVSDDTIQRAAANHGSSVIEIDVARGTIYDRGGKPLTGTYSTFAALCSPTPEAIAAASKLPDSESVLDRLRQGRPALIQVSEPLDAAGITIFKLIRRYSAAQPAAHLIGYLDSTRKNGVTGLEKAYNDILTGDTVYARFAIDARGDVLTGIDPEINNSAYSQTGSLKLTLDADIQKIAEQAVARHLSTGAVIVSEPSTGKILACVSAPGFSPNNPGESINGANSPMINRAFYAYNVGSVFKLVVAAAALEQGISPSYSYHCTGSLRVGNLSFNCHSTHNSVQMPNAIRSSCNLYFIDLAEHIGAAPIHRMAAALGFGQSRILCRGIIPEAGKLTSLSILSDQPAALANFAFGQGDLMLTPLQISTLISAIACDGKAYAPSLVESAADARGNIIEQAQEPVFTRIMSAQTAEKLRSYMLEVVASGTGRAGKPKNGVAGAKTGTAETGWLRDGKRVVQAWFSGFYPAENPQFVITVLAENGVSGGTSAGPVFKEIADGLCSKFSLY